MKLKWNGHACFTITLSNGLTIVTDPFDPSVGYQCPRDCADVVTISHGHHDHNYLETLTGRKQVLDAPGQTQVGGATISALPSFHDDEGGAKRGKNLIFKFEADGETLVHLGDLGHMPNAAQLAFIRGATVLLIPIGGFYTIDTQQALEIIRAAAPRCAVAMHFKTAVNDFPISDESEFVAKTGAVHVKINELPIADIPSFAIFDYEEPS